VEERRKELEGCKYTFACPRRLVVTYDLFPDGEKGDKTKRTKPSEKEREREHRNGKRWRNQNVYRVSGHYTTQHELVYQHFGLR
jgi:muconolactone delta-isomerase